MDNQRLEGAHIIGVLVGFAAFGLYTCLFVQTCYYVKQISACSIVIPISLTILWILTLASTVFQASSIYDAFVTFKGEMEPTLYFALWFKRWQFTGIITVNSIAALIGNMFICWRLFAVWNRRWKVLIAPLALLLGMTVCCIMTVMYSVMSRFDDRYWPMKNVWQIAAVVFTLAINILVMSLLCWKIWRVLKSVSGLNSTASSFFQKVLQVLIESGALYAIAVLASVVLQTTNQIPATVVVAYLLPQVIGLIPTLIILRLRIDTLAPASQGGSGHDTFSATSHQGSISRPVFARMAAGTITTTTTQLSETYYSLKIKPTDTLEKKLSSHRISVAEEEKPSDISGKFHGLGVDLENSRTS